MPVAPQDHKSADTFTFRAENGASVSLPKMGTLPSGVLRKYRKLSEVDFVFSVVEEVCDEETLDAVDQIPLGELNDLFHAWATDSGVTPGE